MIKTFNKRIMALLLSVTVLFCAVMPQIISLANSTPADVLIIDDENAVNESGVTLNVANWASTIETDIVKVGNKSLKSVSGNDRIAASQYVWRTTEFNTPKDITDVTNNGTSGVLRFWFYIEDIATFDAKNRDESKGFVKIGTTTWKNSTTPNSGPDAGSFYRWNGWTTQVTESGWNEIILKFEDASKQNGTPDLTCIDKFMIAYPDGTAATTAYIDEFKVTASTEPPQESEPASSEKVVLPIEGSKSGKGLFNLVYDGFVADASNIVNPHLQISVYIAKDDDPTASVSDLLGKRQIELTSSGTYDKAEIHWDMSQFTLETGWNNLLLPLSEAVAHEGGENFDISAINYFRLYNQHLAGGISYTLKVKDVAIVSVAPSTPPLNTDEINLQIDDSKSGTGGLSISKTGFTFDASNISNPHLQISVYIARDDDVTSTEGLFGNGEIELTSSGRSDVAEKHWKNQRLNLKAGWNILCLPFSEAYNTDGGSEFDISNINYFRIYHNPADKNVSYTLKVKDVSIISPDESETITNIKVIAKLDGTEWPIVHPGLSGQFNNPDYEAMNFDRRFSGIPSGDIRTSAYVTRSAKKWEPIDATENNIFTFDMLVEDNGSWDTYKDGIIIKLRTADNGQIAFSANAVKEAFKSVVVGEKSRVVLSLASIGKKNLSKIDGFTIELGDTISDKVLHLTITNACVEYSEDYPDVSEEPIVDEKEKETEEVLFAKLDGTEWPIVHPGLSGEFHTADFDAKNFDRYLNFTNKGDIRNFTDVIRTDVYKDDPADFSKCNVLTFNVFIEDNGAWEDYKGKIKMSLVSTDNVTHPLATVDVTSAFSKVVLNEWCEVTVSLSGLHKGELENIKTVKFSVSGGNSNKNLHLRVLRITGEYNESFKEVPETPSNNDNTLILNDEYGEKAWPASLTNDISKFGNKSYSATTFVTDKGYNEGWLIRMGFWGNPINRVLNIKEIAGDGTQGAIRFWVYAEDAEKVRTLAALNAGSYCRYGSSNNWDGDAFEWRGWANQIVYDGWNEIVLPFDIATKRGNPDLTKMSAFALKFGEGEVEEVPKTQIYIDDIRLSENTKTALPISYEPTIKGAKMFQPFDETTGLNKETKMTSFELDLKDKTQGMASLKYTIDNGNFCWLYRAGKNIVDASGYNAIEFDLYVSDPAFFEYAGGQIEITSSGTWDQNEMAFNLKELKLNKGWNHVKLSFDFASYSLNWKGEPDIDLTAINFMRVYTGKAESFIGKELTFKFDNMCFTKNGDIKVEKTVVITNDTGYELYLTAKPNVIPSYGEIVVIKNDIAELPETIRSLFKDEKNTVILSPTYYKDSIEYLFNDSVTVHLSSEKFAGFKNKYIYRLDINGSFKKLSRIDNKSKKELTWEESSRLATYIISDVLIDDKTVIDVENNLVGNSKGNNAILSIIVVSVSVGFVVLFGGISAIILIKKRKNKFQ